MKDAPRETLPQRRRSETFNMTFDGQSKPFAVTLGYYPDGRIGEVFIDGGGIGSQIAGIARDGAVLISLSLQHGVPMQTIQGAITRNGEEKAATIIGAVVDEIVKRENA